jgi:hypothetical protein
MGDFNRPPGRLSEDTNMPFPPALPARKASILVVGSLVALHSSWAAAFSPDLDRRSSLRNLYVATELAASGTPGSRSSSSDQAPKAAARSTVAPPPSDGSCEEVAARQASAYVERLTAKDYSAAKDIARKTADVCLEAGDYKRAKEWFQTARAVGGRESNRTPEQDEQFRRRYQQGVARVRPPQRDLAAADGRMAERRALATGTDSVQGPRSTASKAAIAAPPVSEVPINRRLGSAQFSWIAAAGGLGLLLLGAAVLRRNGAALLRRGQRTTNARRHYRQLHKAPRLR